MGKMTCILAYVELVCSLTQDERTLRTSAERFIRYECDWTIRTRTIKHIRTSRITCFRYATLKHHLSFRIAHPSRTNQDAFVSDYLEPSYYHHTPIVCPIYSRISLIYVFIRS